MFGKRSGCSRGCGGSMHMFNPAKGFMAVTVLSAAAFRWRWGRL
ncbi:MAG: hypothetical protein PHV82_19295 [Victivallaceae bacterium]|nr:hypothetical protein [Victivallaceae bacterium]